MSTEAAFTAGYAVVLLAVVGGLELYGRQPTSAWSARIFTGYRRAVPDAPQPADPGDWPHSEVGRFHLVVTRFIAVIAVVLIGAELIRNHQPLEAAVLIAVAGPHALIASRLLRRWLSPRRGEAASSHTGQ